MSHDCCVALPHDSMGLSAVCDCGITSSYSLTVFTGVGPFLFNPSYPGGPLPAADPVGAVGPLPILFSLLLGDPDRPLVLCPLSLTVLWEAC